jgi:hypothetical protein
MSKPRTTMARSTRGSSPAGAPELVGTLLDQARRTCARRAGVALDHESWREVVGERIARRTTPGSVRDGLLTVMVESPVWAQELSLLSEEIVARLSRHGLAVTGIRFRTGKVARAPTPPGRRAASPPVELPDDVRERLAGVDDPDLREVIATAVAHSLANQARAKVTPKPGARTARCVEPRTARSDPSAPKPSAKSRQGRGER